MTFRCELCERVPALKDRGPRVVPPGEKCAMVPIEMRPAEYPSRPKAQRSRAGGKRRLTDDPGGAGYEIAVEVKACMRCAADYAVLRAAERDEA